MKSNNIRYVPAIDELRGLAALVVLLYHGTHAFTGLSNGFVPSGDGWIHTHNPFLAVILEGHFGVGLFLVLSGFIFTFGSYGKTISYRDFLANRALRIFPLMLTILVFGLCILPNTYSTEGLLQTLFMLHNLGGGLEQNIFTGTFWTISIEFQFYLVFPFLMLFYQRYGARYLVGLMILALTFRTLGLFVDASPRDYSYRTILGRLDQFLIGMFAARIYLSDVMRPRAGMHLLAATCLALGTLYAFHRAGGWINDANWKILWPLLEGGVLAYFVVSYISAFEKVSSLPRTWLKKVGEASYSIYLIHYFVMVVVLVGKNWIIQFGLAPVYNGLVNALFLLLPLSLTISFLSYRTIELPFLELRRRYLKNATAHAGFGSEPPVLPHGGPIARPSAQ